jgi:hypothetical protein
VMSKAKVGRVRVRKRRVFFMEREGMTKPA